MTTITGTGMTTGTITTTIIKSPLPHRTVNTRLAIGPIYH